MKTYVSVPTADFFLSVKVGATHEAAHYVI